MKSLSSFVFLAILSATIVSSVPVTQRDVDEVAVARQLLSSSSPTSAIGTTLLPSSAGATLVSSGSESAPSQLPTSTIGISLLPSSSLAGTTLVASASGSAPSQSQLPTSTISTTLLPSSSLAGTTLVASGSGSAPSQSAIPSFSIRPLNEFILARTISLDEFILARQATPSPSPSEIIVIGPPVVGDIL